MRYFEVKVHFCMDCPNHNDTSRSCNIAPYAQWSKVAAENQYRLTPSCPMWNESKEDVK